VEAYPAQSALYVVELHREGHEGSCWPDPGEGTALQGPIEAAIGPEPQMASDVRPLAAIDYRALFFFFYLTDVDSTTGPHMVARGSHRRKKLRHRLSLFVGRPDGEIIEYYGGDNVVTVTGPAGTGFAEDPFCFHRGTPPTSGDRLMLRVHFRISDYGPAKAA
jgi:hypothetical protein